jgi:hypothetical protein
MFSDDDMTLLLVDHNPQYCTVCQQKKETFLEASKAAIGAKLTSFSEAVRTRTNSMKEYSMNVNMKDFKLPRMPSFDKISILKKEADVTTKPEATNEKTEAASPVSASPSKISFLSSSPTFLSTSPKILSNLLSKDKQVDVPPVTPEPEPVPAEKPVEDTTSVFTIDDDDPDNEPGI